MSQPATATDEATVATACHEVPVSDGVDASSAVLVHVPQGKNAWWVSAANVQAAD